MVILKNFINLLIIKLKSFLRPFYNLIKYRKVFISGNVEISNCSFGYNVKLYDGVKISKTKIGDFTYVGGNTIIKNSLIGKFCSIAPDVKIGLGIHPTNFVSTYPGFYSKNASGSYKFNYTYFKEYDEVIIGNDVWIGSNVMISDGVKIGNGSIIAAGAVVTKDVEDYSIVGGVPAKLIKYRFDNNTVSKLLELKWWDWDRSKIYKNSNLFINPNDLLKLKK